MPYANIVPRTSDNPDGVYAESLSKSFGDVQALREASFHAPAGSVLGLLGHNGGKTTAVRILTTLALPTSGRALVAGVDPVTQPAQVRAHIGLTGQSATVDGLLSARANLELVGGLPPAARDRAPPGGRAARAAAPRGRRRAPARRTPAACAAVSILPRA